MKFVAIAKSRDFREIVEYLSANILSRDVVNREKYSGAPFRTYEAGFVEESD